MGASQHAATKADDARDAIRLVWFRRDLRCDDHAALAAALAELPGDDRVACVFVFDTTILDALPDRIDRRVEFILASLAELDDQLRRLSGGLYIGHGDPVDLIPRLADALGADTVHANRDYEPAAIARDAEVAERLRAAGRDLVLNKDQCIFDGDEVLTGDGRPFSVFTPYRNAWMRRLRDSDLEAHPISAQGRLQPPAQAVARKASVGGEASGEARSGETGGIADGRKGGGGRFMIQLPSLTEIGFQRTDLHSLGVPTGTSGAERLFDEFHSRIDSYHEQRNYPARRGSSFLSVHLRFGTVSIRRLARFAHQLMQADADAAPGARTWLSELIWRDFYFQILAHHPRVVDRSFKADFDRVVWQDGAEADARFEAWCAGRTGYPLVDAAQRQLVTYGWMHNRLRMVSASFFVKDLGLDWRRGERFFARYLLDYDMSANNGGWQWAASTGCDAQPWFRIFNPVTQSLRFDANGDYIRGQVAALAGVAARDIHAPWLADPARLAAAGVKIGVDYPAPIVDHDVARQRTLERFAAVRGK